MSCHDFAMNTSSKHSKPREPHCYVISDPKPCYLLNPVLPRLSLGQDCKVLFRRCLNYAFHSALGLSMTSRRKGQVKAWGSTFVKRKKTNFLPFLSKGKHRSIPPSIRVLIYAIFYLTLLYVHLSIGVQWNPRLHYDTLPVYLVYPYEGKSHDSMAMLSNSGLR